MLMVGSTLRARKIYYVEHEDILSKVFDINDLGQKMIFQKTSHFSGSNEAEGDKGRGEGAGELLCKAEGGPEGCEGQVQREGEV